MAHLIGIMCMTAGLLAMSIKNYDGAFILFGYALILWCVLAIYEYKEYRKAEKDKEIE